MQETAKEYRDVSEVAEEFKEKVFIEDRSLGVVMEELLESLHLKRKLSGIKPTINTGTDKYSIEGIEVNMERLYLNELINLLYAIENGREGFVLKSLKIKKDFSQSERLNIVFEVSAIKIKSG